MRVKRTKCSDLRTRTLKHRMLLFNYLLSLGIPLSPESNHEAVTSIRTVLANPLIFSSEVEKMRLVAYDITTA